MLHGHLRNERIYFAGSSIYIHLELNLVSKQIRWYFYSLQSSPDCL